MPDLSDVFAEQQSNVIEWNGAPVYGLYEFNDIPGHIRVAFMKAKLSPVQGVQLRIRGGVLVVNGQAAEDVTLWRDSAPDTVEVDVRPNARGRTSLKLWNVWRGGRDVTQAWLGNAAIQVDGDPGTGNFVLRCSDGHSEPTFDDLVVAVTTE
jgi:hypothetical protein